MLDLGWPELLLIAIVLIVVVGPKDLPRVLRTFGRTTSKLRAMAGDFRKQFDEAMREAELDDVKSLVEDAKQLDPRSEIKKHLSPLQEAGRDIRSGLEEAAKPKTSAGKSTTPAEAKPEDAPKSAPAKSTAAKSTPAKPAGQKTVASGTKTNAKAPASSSSVKPAAKATTAKRKTGTSSAAKSKAASPRKRTNTAARGKKNVGSTS